MEPGGFLASLLRVERVAEDEFTARLHDYEGVSFGGDALGRLALAAAHCAGDKTLHSLHATFLRPVPPSVPVRIQVETLADGRRLARRRARLLHEGRLLCDATLSFVAAASGGAQWQEIDAPRVPAPEELLPDDEIARREGWTHWDFEQEEFAWGWIGTPWRAWERQPERSEPTDSTWSTWLRPRVPLPPDPRVHAAALAFASDYLSHWSASQRLRVGFGPGGFASLDHVLRIHRATPWDDWWLLHSRSEVARDGRALWHRQVFARDGALIASISQEGLISAPPAPA